MSDHPRKAPVRQRPRPTAGAAEATTMDEAPIEREPSSQSADCVPAPPDPNPGYTVGYGRPPRHSQFRKGRSGNARGRPKGALDLRTLVQQILAQKITVTGPNGRPRRVSKGEMLITNLTNRAIKGEDRAVNQILRIVPMVDPATHPTREPGRSAGRAGSSGGSDGLSLSPDVLLAVAGMLAKASPEALEELLAQEGPSGDEREPAASSKGSKTPAKPPAEGEDA